MWRLVKDGKRAHAAIRMLEHGAELRVYVNDSLIVSHLHHREAVTSCGSSPPSIGKDSRRSGGLAEYAGPQGRHCTNGVIWHGRLPGGNDHCVRTSQKSATNMQASDSTTAS